MSHLHVSGTVSREENSHFKRRLEEPCFVSRLRERVMGFRAPYASGSFTTALFTGRERSRRARDFFTGYVAIPFLLLCWLTISRPMLADEPPATGTPHRSDYAVVVSNATQSQPEWKQVVDAVDRCHVLQVDIATHGGNGSDRRIVQS